MLWYHLSAYLCLSVASLNWKQLCFTHSRCKRNRTFIYTLSLVALHTHEDSVIGLTEVSTPKDARKKLENYISKRNFNDDSQDYDEEKKREPPFRRQFAEEDDENDSEPETNVISGQKLSIENWIDNLITKTRNTLIVGENLNAFYVPDFIERFIAVAKEFPLWTAVGIPLNTRRATSSYIEDYFNELKTRTLKHYTLPIFVNKFIREQVKDIEDIEDIEKTNYIVSGKIVQHNNNRLHENYLETVNQLETGKDIKTKTKNMSNCMDIPSENAEKNDSDLFAIKNWSGKGNAPYFNNHNRMQMNIK